MPARCSFRCGHAGTRSNTYTLANGTRTCRACRHASTRRYAQSAKGRATRRRYAGTAKAYAARQRWRGMRNQAGRPVTVEDLALERQRTRGRCALCGKRERPEDKLVPDHSHDTGKLRGFVHQSENVAEAQLRRAGVITDDPRNLANLVKWARRLHRLIMRGRK